MPTSIMSEVLTQLSEAKAQRDKQDELLARIIRGMYGDEENGVKGLIKRQEEDEKVRGVHAAKLEQLEKDCSTNTKFRKKATTIVTGGGLATGAGGAGLLHWLKSLNLFQ